MKINSWFKKLLKIKKKKTVSVIFLHGVIGSSGRFGGDSFLNLKSLKCNIDKAFENKSNVAVALAINSPGGSPVQSELIYEYIKLKSSEAKVPVLSFVEDVAASGGYWLACTGKEIYASKNSIIGSIGVITAGFGFVEIIKKLGIERRVITQGMNKSVYDPFKPVQSKDIKIIENIQQDIHHAFIDIVKKSRGNKIDQNNKILFTGEFWSGVKAKELGLIDGIGDLDNVLKEKFGNTIKINCITTQKPLIKRLLSAKSKNIVTEALAEIKEDFYWNRFGL